MNDVTLVMPFYRNGGMLTRHYDELRSLPIALRSHIHMVVVDDASPENPALPPTEDVGIGSIQIYRMDKDIPWNQDACRNIGVKHADTDWILLTDIDHLPPLETWQCLVEHEFNPGVAYRFSRVSAPYNTPYKPHPNSYFLAKRLYQKSGGYDERYAGYYGTDGVFLRFLREACNDRFKQLKVHLIRYPREVIPDASTSTLTRKSEENTKHIYRIRNHIALLPRDQQRPVTGQFSYHKVHP